MDNGNDNSKVEFHPALDDPDQEETRQPSESIQRPDAPKQHPPYVSVPVRELHEDFFRNIFSTLLESGIFHAEKESRNESPFLFRSPDALKSEIDFTLGDKPTSQDKLISLVKKVIEFSPHVGHPFYMEQRGSGLDPYGVIADIVATAFNNNVVIYLISQSYTMMEEYVLEAVRSLVGYSKTSEGNGDGVVTPGSSLANSYAMQVAVRTKFPCVKETGVFGSRSPVIFVAEGSQYSYCKAAIFQGLGLNAICTVPCNPRGQMDVNSLRECIEDAVNNDMVPVMVVGIAGSSILRAFDPIQAIADVAQEFNLWFHVDATWGGGCLLSPSHRRKLQGAERSDSFTWSQHFILSAPYTSAVLVFPENRKGTLRDAMDVHEQGNYAFIHTPLYDPKYDTGHAHLQTSRRPEIFKFWLMWKAKGTNGLGEHIDYIFANTQFCVTEIRRRGKSFHLILDEVEGTNVCFFYVPPALRSLDFNGEEFINRVGEVAPSLQSTLLHQGIVSICCHKLPGKRHFLTMVLHNSALTHDDIAYVLDQIEAYGEKLDPSIYA